MSNKYDTASLVQTREDRYSAGVYDKRGLTLMRGEGAYVWDERGVRYIDCVSGQGSSNLGHANPDVAAAIAEQAQRLLSCPEVFYNDKRSELLEKLSDITPDLTTRFLLCNSETEATELSLQFAWLVTGRTDIVVCGGRHHGPAPEAASADQGREYRDVFPPGFGSVPFNDPERLAAAITEQTAAVILELVQSGAGLRVATEEFVRETARVCQARGALLIINEAQTGFGRTGRMFALNYYGLQPDIIVMAGSIANGLPMGAIAITKAVGDKLIKLPYPLAFGGNPLACAAACATIDYLRDYHLVERAESMGDYFIARLRETNLPKIVKAVRGRGLLVGVELTTGSDGYTAELAAQGVLTLPAGPEVIRYLPPLVITKEDLDVVVEKTAQVLAQ